MGPILWGWRNWVKYRGAITQQSYGKIVQRKVWEEMSVTNSRIQQNNKKGMGK